MYAVPVIFVAENGEYSFHNGMLLSVPPELSGKSKVSGYAKLRNPGWHKADYDYWSYVSALEDGRRRVFIGISLNDYPPKKHFGRPPLFSKAQFEAYVRNIDAREKANLDEAESSFNILVHDLRRLSTSIYHAAEEARHLLHRHDVPGAATRIENIIAAQSMLKLRTDVLDYSGNPSDHDAEREVKVFRKVDKVVRSFMPTAEKRNLKLCLEGSSFGISLGPDVFEIVPYLLIDNAIKYSPENASIVVSCKDAANTIEISVSSMGPNIEIEERDRIFDRGYRSNAARASEKAGTGVGLSLAKQLVHRFNGSVWVTVGEKEIPATAGPCRDITFNVSLPRSK